MKRVRWSPARLTGMQGSKDVHSRVTRTGSKTYQSEHNGGTSQLNDTNMSFCVVNLYFLEPVGIIFEQRFR